MMTANLFKRQGTVTLDVAYDACGAIALTGHPLLVSAFADWLSTATGFQGHGVGYPIASPRDLHAALLYEGAKWGVSEIQVDDAKPLQPLPEGAVS